MGSNILYGICWMLLIVGGIMAFLIALPLLLLMAIVLVFLAPFLAL